MWHGMCICLLSRARHCPSQTPDPRRPRALGGHSEQVAQAYNVVSLPRYYLVDPQGLIVENNLSLFDTDEVVAKIEENL